MFGNIEHRIDILENEVTEIERCLGVNGLDEVSEACLHALKGQLCHDPTRAMTGA